MEQRPTSRFAQSRVLCERVTVRRTQGGAVGAGWTDSGVAALAA
jgi:hypothetical protein